jgi:group I intron endonuclease
MEQIGYIYKITSPSGKSYIGQTIEFEKRMKRHSRGKDETKLSRSIKKYGWEAHIVDILWEGLCTKEQLNSLEVEFIKLYDTLHNGLNLTEGGEGARGMKHSEETKAKISATRKGKPGISRSEETKAKMSETRRGRPCSEETRAKISAAKKGKPGMLQSEETKAKMSAAHKGKPKSEEHKAKMRGRKHSQETKARISTAHKGRSHSEETKQKLREAWKVRREGRVLNKS